MSYSLYLAVIQHEGSFDQSLTVTCGAGAYDCRIIREQRVDLLNRADCSFEWAAVIITVERIQQKMCIRDSSIGVSLNPGLLSSLDKLMEITGIWL